MRYGKPCPGYPPSFQFRYDRAGKPPKVSLTEDSQPCMPLTTATRILNDYSLHGDHIVLSYFASQYIVATSANARLGHLDFLPLLYGRDESLDLATLAISYLCAYHHSGHELFWRRSRLKYGACLLRLRTVIASQETAVTEEVFVSLLLLSMFVV